MAKKPVQVNEQAYSPSGIYLIYERTINAYLYMLVIVMGYLLAPGLIGTNTLATDMAHIHSLPFDRNNFRSGVCVVARHIVPAFSYTWATEITCGIHTAKPHNKKPIIINNHSDY